MSHIITGLDLGSSQVKCVVAEKKKDGTLNLISAFKHQSAGFRKGILSDAEDAGRILEEIVRELKQISKEAARNVYLNINSEHIKVRISRGIAAVSQPDKEIRQEDIDRAIQASRAAKVSQNYKVLHTMIRESLVDDVDVNDVQTLVGMTGSRIEVTTLIVEVFAPHMDALSNAFQSAGGEIGGMVFNPFATSYSVLSKKQKELGVLMIDIGAGTTSLSVFEENKPLYAKSFAMGSGHITNDIAIGLKISIETAEKLKLDYGTMLSKNISRKNTIKLSSIDPSLSEEISRHFIADVIETRVAEITEIINNEIKQLRNKFQFPAGAVITGGGVKLEGILGFMRKELKLPVQIGLPNIGNFEITNPAYETLIDDSEFATAVGLVLSGIEGKNAKSTNPLYFIRKIIKNLIP